MTRKRRKCKGGTGKVKYRDRLDALIALDLTSVKLRGVIGTIDEEQGVGTDA